MGHSEIARNQACVIFSVVGKSGFRVLDTPASGLASTAADSRALCGFHLSHRIETGVFSLASQSLQFTMTTRSVLCKHRSSETIHT